MNRVALVLSLAVACASSSDPLDDSADDPADIVADDDSYDDTDTASAAAGPGGFHFVFQSSLPYWDAILDLSQTTENVLFVAGTKPAQVAHDRWVAYLSYRSNPRPTAADVNALLSAPEAPRFVMFEELHDSTSQAFFVALANELRTQYPQWAGRWGVFVGYGNYRAWQPALDALLRANAIIALELYPEKPAYCASSPTVAGRDLWLANQFKGTAAVGRLDFLLARRAALGSASFISPLLGVGDVLLGDTHAAIFLDRIFYVWATRTGYRRMILATHGGPGAYKWQTVTETPLRYGITSTARDDQFVASFAHYSAAGLTRSRLGPVNCP